MKRKLVLSIGAIAISLAMAVATQIATITLQGPDSAHSLQGSMIAVVVGAIALAVLAAERRTPEIGIVGILATAVTLATSIAFAVKQTEITDPILSHEPWAGYALIAISLVAFFAIASEGTIDEGIRND